MSEQVKTWVHSRKGVITGAEVGGDETWAHIELAENHRLDYGSESNRGRVDGKGEVLTVRRSLLAELGNDGLTDAERAESAARYAATAASSVLTDADRRAIEFIKERRAKRAGEGDE